MTHIIKFFSLLLICAFLLVGAIFIIFYQDESDTKVSIANNTVVANENDISAEAKSYEVCEYKPVASSKAVVSNLREELHHQLKQLAQERVRVNAINRIFSQSGIDTAVGYKIMRTNNDIKNVSLVLVSDDEPFSQENILASRLANENDIWQIVEAYSKRQLDPKKLLIVDYKSLSPFQFVYSVAMTAEQDKKDIVKALSVLIEENVTVRFTDLVWFTRLTKNTDVLDILLQGFDGNLDSTFFYIDGIHTLTTVAVKQQNIEQMRFWLAKGVSATPGRFLPNSLDIALVVEDDKKLLEMITSLYQYQTMPFYSKTSAVIKKRLNNFASDDLEKMMHAFDHHYLLPNERELITVYVNKMHQAASTKLSLSKICALDRVYIAGLINAIMVPQQQTQLYSASNTQVENTLNDERYVKLAQENKVVEEQALVSELTKHELAMLKLLKAGNWQQAVELHLEENKIAEEQVDDFTFLAALLANASDQVLIDIIEIKEPIIAPELAYPIVNGVGLDVIKTLNAHNFDFKHLYPDGSNSLCAAYSANKKDIFAYLLGIGVPLVNGPQAPFERAIRNIAHDREKNVEFIELMLNSGMVVTSKQRVMIKQLSVDNTALYLKLIQQFPRLKV